MPAQIAQAVLLDVDTVRSGSGLRRGDKNGAPGWQGLICRFRNGRPGRPSDPARPPHRCRAGLRPRCPDSGSCEAAHLQASRHPIAFHGPLIDLGRLVELLENAFGPGQALLDGAADFGKLANRLGSMPAAVSRRPDRRLSSRRADRAPGIEPPPWWKK